MKIFITFSIFAMISAGAYGIVDMSHDVFEGTMINYRQAEQEMQQTNETLVDTTENEVTGTYGHAGVQGNSSGEQLVSYVMRSYSRGEPEKVKVVKKKSAKEDSIEKEQLRLALKAQNTTSVAVSGSGIK